MDVTIVISPRERYSSIVNSLDSLFDTISDDVRVIVIDGIISKEIDEGLRTISKYRRFDHVTKEYMLTPNMARNIGGDMAKTKYIVFADNDIEYSEGWLEKLVQNAERNRSGAVAPLIFIGPNDPPIIHHAGGQLEYVGNDENGTLSERHRLMNWALDDVGDRFDDLAPVENEVCEFHCMLMTKEFFDTMGGMDERLITREQMDVALRAKFAGVKVTFEKDSHVTYNAQNPFRGNDIEYHLFRWSDAFAKRSLDAFQDTWRVGLDEKRIRYGWIRRHRERAVASMYPGWRKRLGQSVFRHTFVGPMEKRIDRQVRAFKARHHQLRIPSSVTSGPASAIVGVAAQDAK